MSSPSDTPNTPEISVSGEASDSSTEATDADGIPKKTNTKDKKMGKKKKQRRRKTGGPIVPSDTVPRKKETANRVRPVTKEVLPDRLRRASTLSLSEDDLEEWVEVDTLVNAAKSSEQESSVAEAPHSPPPLAEPPPAPPPSQFFRNTPVAREWFEEIFDDDYLRTLPYLTPQVTKGEAQFVADCLGVAASAQLLDLGCGYGRHAMELSAQGHDVVGVDLSLALLTRGADEAQRRGLAIHFVHGDMRELSFDSQFDGVYCLFSTFGYFDDDTNKKTMDHICRALKPGGRLVISVLNRDYIVPDLPSRVWWEGDGCVVLEEVEFNYFSSRVVSHRSVVYDDGKQLEQEISLRVYGLHEFGKLLHSAGLHVLEISGSMATRGKFFGCHSREIIVLAERPV